MANILQKQYSSVFTEPLQHYDLSEAEIEDNGAHLNDINFMEDNIIEEINTLSSNSAPGPDGFPAILLKMLKYNLPHRCVLSGEIYSTRVTHHSY